MSHIGKDILKRNTLKTKVIEVPEWGGTILIRELTGKEKIPIDQGAIEISQARQKGALSADTVARWQAQAVVSGWINEDGSLVLQPSDIDELLAKKEGSVIERIAVAVRVLTGMEKAKEDDASPKEDAKKN